MKRILPIFLLLTSCQTDAPQPTVESANAQVAAREGRCVQQGYKRGTKDFMTCVQIAYSEDYRRALQGDNQTAQNAALGAGAAVVGLSLLSAFSDERLKRDITPVGTENGYKVYRFRYVWSDDEYIGVIAQEVQRIRPDAVVVDSDGLLRVNYEKIGVTLRRLQ